MYASEKPGVLKASWAGAVANGNNSPAEKSGNKQPANRLIIIQTFLAVTTAASALASAGTIRWGETPSSPDLQRIEIRLDGVSPHPVSWEAPFRFFACIGTMGHPPHPPFGPRAHFGIDCPKALARVFPQFPEKNCGMKDTGS